MAQRSRSCWRLTLLSILSIASGLVTQAELGNKPPQPAAELLQPAGAALGGDQLPKMAEAGAATIGIEPTPESAHGAEMAEAAAAPEQPAAAGAAANGTAPMDSNGPADAAAPAAAQAATEAAPQATPAAAGTNGEQPQQQADGAAPAPKRKRRSKWDTTADATPVPAVAAVTPPLDAGIPGLANGAALPPPPAAATTLPPGTPGANLRCTAAACCCCFLVA